VALVIVRHDKGPVASVPWNMVRPDRPALGDRQPGAGEGTQRDTAVGWHAGSQRTLNETGKHWLGHGGGESPAQAN
jgi:hypothetical protein